MRLAVITPVGPGHEAVSMECAASITFAWTHSQGPFDSLRHELIDDSRGEIGRSRARNIGVRANTDADWFMFIDADDLCRIEAFRRFGAALLGDAEIVALFGAIYTDRHGILPENVHPLEWTDLMDRGAEGTLSMGCFIRAGEARATQFNERMDIAEDFDFYLRVLSGRPWAKIDKPLVTIRESVPAASGPRGLAATGWREACQGVVDRWKEAECLSIPA